MQSVVWGAKCKARSVKMQEDACDHAGAVADGVPGGAVAS